MKIHYSNNKKSDPFTESPTYYIRILKKVTRVGFKPTTFRTGI